MDKHHNQECPDLAVAATSQRERGKRMVFQVFVTRNKHLWARQWLSGVALALYGGGPGFQPCHSRNKA